VHPARAGFDEIYANCGVHPARAGLRKIYANCGVHPARAGLDEIYANYSGSAEADPSHGSATITVT
jgi:hypothetical protein